MMIQKDKKLSNSHKTPSLRDLFLGKKVVKSLPENFFEKVLDLELKIKRDFKMNLLQELINYYSMAIEYYESKEDPKFKDYENRLNSLLCQPDILMKMNDFSKVGVNKEFLTPSKKFREKTNIAKKVMISTNTNNNKIVNEGKVQNIIKDINNNENIGNLVGNDMNAQKETFQKRLEDRKQKKLLSTSDCTTAIETMVSIN